jgi:hypothetical protein
MATTTEGSCISIFCTECGKPNAETSKFCFSCGNTLASGVTQQVAVGSSQAVTTAPALVAACASITPEFQRFDKIFQAAFWLIGCAVYLALLTTAISPNTTFLQAGFSGAVVVGCFYLYFLPTHLAIKRSKSNRMAIFAVDFFLGWTLIGWVVALSWALTKEKPETPGF